jgi:single-stranded-DNA-specific exonuclease
MDLFNEEDLDVASLICKDIIKFNEDRKKLTEQIVEGLEGTLSDDKITIVDMTDSGHKRGMFGLIAGKLSKERQRPCFFGSVYDGEFKGSARGFGDHIKLKNILKESELFTLAAGHQNAFGVGFMVDKMQEIKDFVNERFKNDYSEIVAEYDLELDYEEMDEHSLQLIDDISFICGQGFRRPIFLVKGLTVDKMAKIGKDKNHTKLSKEDEMNLDIMKFNTKETLDRYEEADYIDVVGNIGLNKFYNFGLKKVVVSKQILANEIICQTIDI